jgi:APA family basic amino acid/polyamine antiporter
MLLLIIATGALASLALAFGGYLAAFFPLSAGAQKIAGVLIIIAFSALNVLGVKPGARTTTLLTVIKVAAIVLFIGLGLVMEPRQPPTATIDLPATGTMLLGFGAALVPVLFSYGGWQQLNFLAGEVRSPERRVPLALALGVSIVAFVYVGANVVYLRALGPGGMAASTALARDAGVVLFGEFASRAITALVAISILAFSNVVIMATPRVFYALAQDGVFLRGLSVLHPRFHTPARAIVLQGIWAIVLVLIGNIGALVNGVVFADWIFFGLGAASIFVIRRRDKTTPAFQVPGYPLVPAFFVLAALVAVGSAILAYPKESSLGVGLLAVGAGLFNIFRRRSV